MFAGEIVSRLSSIEYLSYIPHDIQKDSMLLVTDSSVHFSKTPNRRLIKYHRLTNGECLVFDLRSEESIIDTVKLEEFKILKKKFKGADTLYLGYNPKTK